MSRIMGGMVLVLKDLDAARFRIIAEVPDDTPNAVVLEAMHRARVLHPGVNRKLTNDSKRWLEANT